MKKVFCEIFSRDYRDSARATIAVDLRVRRTAVAGAFSAPPAFVRVATVFDRVAERRPAVTRDAGV